MSPISKVIFDNDGVNIDSETTAMHVMDVFGFEFVKKYAPETDINLGDIYREYPGTSTDKIIEKLIEKFDLPEDQIRTDYQIDQDEDTAVFIADLVTIETINSFCNGDLKSIPGVTNALDILINRFSQENIALCTTSREDRMDVSLANAIDPETGNSAELDKRFPSGPNRISGYGHNNKYELFFETHEDWDPKDCVIVEDTISGVCKAKAANPNLRVVGTVAAQFYEDKQQQALTLLKGGASIVVSDIRDLPNAIEWLEKDFAAEAEPKFSSLIYIRDVPESTIDINTDNCNTQQPKPG